MSISQSVASQLPYLRRFARALSGSQAGGDANVVAMLQAVAANPSLFSADLNPKMATFRTYLKLWNSERLNHQLAPSTFEKFTASDRRLASVTPRARLAYLLMAVEDFSKPM